MLQHNTNLQLSIIIVNYNVKLFLEQCLRSVMQASKGLLVEVFVVDNNSNDGSVAFLQPIFPWVTMIANKENTGFGKANNQALAMATGKYILFLNPDTLLPEDCLQKCFAFMQQNNAAGALGIKMIDGSGSFLAESKRAFPSPATSFFKLTGLANLFPKSKLFARYHLGYLSANENNEVDVLAGAFMWVRKEILDKIGGFDERFFMYGEDVDLSYRIQQAGYKNYYFSESSIIHFKGESTKKGGLNYVRMFYQAMSIFVRKHYGGKKAAVFSFFIQTAILLRAAMTAIVDFIKWIGLPLLDALIVIGCMLATKYVWEISIKQGIAYLPGVTQIALPSFTIIFIIAGSIAGLYDKWYKPRRAIAAMLIAILIILAVYSMLNEQYRFSRGVILFGGIISATAIILFRWFLVKTGAIVLIDETLEKRQTLVVATAKTFDEAKKLMAFAGRKGRLLGRISPIENDKTAIGNLKILHTLLQNMPVREIIFCMDENLSMTEVIDFIALSRKMRHKFHYAKSHGLVGSDSKTTAGETLGAHVNLHLAQPFYQRSKRIFDIVLAIILLLTLPFHLLFIKKRRHFIKNIFYVLLNKCTWVGYSIQPTDLPFLKPHIITTTASSDGPVASLPNKSLLEVDRWYAKNYEWHFDVKIFIKGYRWLGF